MPSSKITASRSDDLIAGSKNYVRAARVIQPQTTTRPTSPPAVQRQQQPPLWTKQSAQSRLKAVSSRLPWKSSQTTISVTTTTGPPVVQSTTSGKPIRQPDARSFRQLAAPSGVVMERLSPTFRPSKPILAATTNSNRPLVRTLRAHPSSTPANGAKRKRSKKTSSVAYDPRLGRPYGENHPIYKLQNWESTKVWFDDSFLFSIFSLQWHPPPSFIVPFFVLHIVVFLSCWPTTPFALVQLVSKM